MKNITIPRKQEYTLQLIHSVSKFMSNIRKRAFFHLNPLPPGTKKETFGFKSQKPAPFVPELKEFEEKMYDLTKNIQFKETKTTFQTKLSRDLKDIEQDNKIYMSADKTNNYYKVEKETYDKLLDENITKDYQKTEPKVADEIGLEDKDITVRLDIENRVFKTSKKNAKITLKDHKPNFRNKPTCRLLNPTKPEIGKISKQILARINELLKVKLKLQQWKHNHAVIKWFNGLSNKQKLNFIQFDMVSFYPSISEALLHKAIEWASEHVDISEEEKEIIFQAKKSLLYNDDQPWKKKGGSFFDVGMGSYDGAETCDIVGLYLLWQTRHLGLNMGLFRDDGLAVSSKTARQTELIKKELCKIFKENGLQITIEANSKVVDFLDVTLNLNDGTYRPYMKPNNNPLYINKQSNHPPNVLNNIPLATNKRISSISSNEDIFNSAAPVYQEALRASGYDFQLKFEPQNNTSQKSKRTRTRNKTYFNPPFSLNVSTNIGKKFFNALDSSFPIGHPLHKLLNRHTVKISYRTMPNMGQNIARHNSKIQSQDKPREITSGCNCQKSKICPIPGKCQSTGVIYGATVRETISGKTETYTGLSEPPFKSRYGGHLTTFKNENANHTTLSKHIWVLKNQKIEHTVDWRIIARSKAYNPTNDQCRLCNKEKYFIMFSPEGASLNARSEFYSSCRHKAKHLMGGKT